jgi:hypothetical protein
MNKFLDFIRDFLFPIFQYALAVGITVLVLCVIPIFVIVLLGIVGMAIAAQITIMVILNTPLHGIVFGILIFIGVIALTGLAILLLLLFLVLIVSLTALPASLIIQNRLSRKQIKSWLIHFASYSISGVLIGVILGLLIVLFAWADIEQLQYSVLTIIAITVPLVLSGIVSVNICGITIGVTSKIQNFLLKGLSNDKSKLISSQGIV